MRSVAAAMVCAVAATATVAGAALSPKPPKPTSSGHSQITLSEGFSRDHNLFGSETFAYRFGAAKGKGQAGDACTVAERRGLRAFRPSPFGLPRGSLWLHLQDRRRPASVTVRRWSSDPNLSAGDPPQILPIRKLVPLRFEGRPWMWFAAVRVPPGEPSWLVARVAWPDPDDCAAGNDFVAAGISFAPLSPPGG